MNGKESLKRRSLYQDPGDNQESTSRQIALQRKISQERGRQTSKRGRCLFWFTVTSSAILVLIWALPSPIDPIAFRQSNSSRPEFVGALSVNNHLKKAKRLFENEIVGPESFAVDKEGFIYTGLSDGRIIRFDSGLKTYTTVLRIGKPPYDRCGTEEAEDHCGRALGIQFSKEDPDMLYVADCSHGLKTVNVKTGHTHIVVPRNSLTGNVHYCANFVNDLVVLPNGSVLFTDSSKKFSRRDNRLEALECRGNGQLLQYDPTDGSVHVLLDGMHFPNGMCLSADGNSVLVVETTRARIQRYYLNGQKAGTTDTFAENLPGIPDNISPSSSGGYWVGFAYVRTSNAMDALTVLPTVRSVIAKLHLLPLVERFFPKHGLIAELDANGHISRSLHDQGGDVVVSTSHVLDLGDALLLGSYHSSYIIKVNLP